MSGGFIGTYENSVHKMRVIIPAQLKSKFSVASKQTVICTTGSDNSIEIYPLDKWNELQDKKDTCSEAEKRIIDIKGWFAIDEQKLEGPGRIRLNEELMEHAGITDSVIIKGERSFISLWSPENYQKVKVAKIKILNSNSSIKEEA